MPERLTMNDLVNIRRDLHRRPELSGEEEKTSGLVTEILSGLAPDALLSKIGGYGVCASFLSENPDEAVSLLFRAELDAIPVDEAGQWEYRSEKKGVMHGCGHDGHMATLLGFASEMAAGRPQGVNIHVLFQPAEETGKGAECVLRDPAFNEIPVDMGFAMHNLPGFAEGKVLLKEGLFAVASSGLEIQITGKSSHAAEPEKGVNPSSLIASILHRVESESRPFLLESATHKVVCTYIRMGDRAFGVSPGEAKIGYTLRAGSDSSLEEIIGRVEEMIASLNQSAECEILTRREEPFRATLNSRKGVKYLKEGCRMRKIPWEELDEPFLWSEDFGRFGSRFPVVLFGVGSGADSEPLHSAKYDFNERLIARGIEVYKGIVDSYSRL